MNRYVEFLDANENTKLLKELLEVRNNYERLNYDNGPYHYEEFLHDSFISDKILLYLETESKCYINKGVSKEIENLIVESNLR